MTSVSSLSSSSAANGDNNFELDDSSSNIATAMVINPNINYHYVNASKDTDNFSSISASNSSFITPESINIDNDIDRVSTPNSFNYNVNNMASNLNNLSVQPINNSTSSTDKNMTFFGSNLVGTSNVGYPVSLVNSAQYNAGLENKCLRCDSQVYALERIGPIKGNIYHKTCFKCLTCERQLDLKTFYTNQVNLTDREIYCQTHAPKSGKGSFGADNVHIQNVLNAPKLDLMHRHDNKYKVSFKYFLLYKNCY